MPFCSRWWYARLRAPGTLPVAYSRSLLQGCLGGRGPHARSVRLRGCPPACLIKGDCDEMPIIHPLLSVYDLLIWSISTS